MLTWFDLGLRSWFSQNDSPIILGFADISFISKFEGVYPERGRWMRVGWVRVGDFRPLSRRISETVQDTTKVLLITNRKSSTRFRFVLKLTTLIDPEMTLKIDPYDRGKDKNSPTFFRTVPFPTHYVPFPQIGGSQPHTKFQSKIYCGEMSAHCFGE